MPIDIADLKAEYQAQANMNAALLTDFNTANPDVVADAQFIDANGLKWQVINFFTFANGNVLPVVAWVNDAEEVTAYQTTLYGAFLESAQFVNNIAFDTVIGQQVYTVSDVSDLASLVGATLLSGDIGGAVLDMGSDLSLNAEDGTITFAIEIAAVQHVQLVYKRKNSNLP